MSAIILRSLATNCWYCENIHASTLNFYRYGTLFKVSIWLMMIYLLIFIRFAKVLIITTHHVSTARNSRWRKRLKPRPPRWPRNRVRTIPELVYYVIFIYYSNICFWIYIHFIKLCHKKALDLLISIYYKHSNIQVNI